MAKEPNAKQKAAKAEEAAKQKNVKILALVDIANLDLVCGQIAEVEASIAESLIEQGKADDDDDAISKHENTEE